jgi:hypothetical protein
MNFSLSRLILSVAAFSALSACSSIGDKPPIYYEEQEVDPLVLPDHLDRPTSTQALYITQEARPLPRQEIVTAPPRITSTSAQNNDNSNFRWSADGVYLFVEDTPDSVERRLGFVLKRSGMVMLNPGQEHAYAFEYWMPEPERDGFFSRFAFWRESPEDYSGAYKIIMRPDGENTRVYLKYADDTECESDAAEHVLSIVRDRLG